MDKQFNFKGLLLLMALALMAQFTNGCDGSGGGSDSTPSSTPKPNQQQDEVTAQLELERLTLTPFPVKTKGTSELTLIMGHKQSFLAVAEYSNGQSQVLTKELTIDDWQSSDTEVGEFIQSGVLQSKDAGVVTVSFTKDNLTSNSVEVAVADAAITDIVITPSAMKVAKGHVQRVTATAIYSNGLSMNVSDSVTWTSDDTSIATITSLNDYSLVKGDDIGSTTLTAFKDGVTSNTVDVEVTNAVITAINVTPSLVNIAKGQNKTLTATAIYSDNTSSNISDSVTWAPVDSSIANVTASGLLSGVKAGMTNLTAKKDGITSNEVGAVISDAVITSISVTPPTITLAKGQTQTLTATAIYSDNTSANISDSVTWKPNDTNTALVSSNGVLSGSNVGTTTLVAVKDSVTSNTIDIDVTDAVITEISVMPSVVNIAKGQRQTLRA
ncbi:Ig-like domain-containing protein, partial [Vibrio neptunius]|uniref:Ig-like domain-containing protein n=1 Tax=Vibrio neptunius TaxID=170651 RepID=UPI0019D20A11